MKLFGIELWKKIGIIDYGLGNIRAFSNIYKMLNVDYKIVQKRRTSRCKQNNLTWSRGF